MSISPAPWKSPVDQGKIEGKEQAEGAKISFAFRFDSRRALNDETTGTFLAAQRWVMLWGKAAKDYIDRPATHGRRMRE